MGILPYLRKTSNYHTYLFTCKLGCFPTNFGEESIDFRVSGIWLVVSYELYEDDKKKNLYDSTSTWEMVSSFSYVLTKTHKAEFQMGGKGNFEIMLGKS